ncbi:MAG: transporter substrate-binding domain-containing protein [Alphaproteobacteria bacterium]|nr:transporter substrate-binding domain-containing protein [Alphaproteobacteria bacterium]
MKKILLSLLLLTLAAPAAWAGDDKESAFDRVMRTGTIRCAYWVSPPLIIRDPNSGKMSGAFVDYVEEIGKALSLKIDWAGELNLSTYLQDLNQGKFDAECSTGWPNALRGKQVEYTKPIGYLPFYVYVRDGVKRFDNNLSRLNDVNVKFSGHDGGTNSLAQQKYFPKSTLASIAGDAPQSEPLDMVKFKKVDATMVTSFEGKNYLEHNLNSIRRVKSAPIRVIPINISVAANEFRFINMLNTATDELMYDGTIERILQKYAIDRETLLRVKLPYE